MFKYTKKVSLIGLIYEFIILVLFSIGGEIYTNDGIIDKFLTFNMQIINWATVPFAYLASLFLRGDLSGINSIFVPFAGFLIGAIIGFIIDMIIYKKIPK